VALKVIMTEVRHLLVEGECPPLDFPFLILRKHSFVDWPVALLCM
jgi:hypothetical protein